MNIMKAEHYEDLSRKAAAIVIGKVRERPKLALGLATGGTPVGLYRELCSDHKLNGTSYRQVRTYNLDEYVGIDPDDVNSYHNYMHRQLFRHLDIPPENTHIPDGMAADLKAECRRYQNLIDRSGGIDLQILGIGHNGHIGFNEPGTAFDSPVHVVTLSEHTRLANSRYFQSIDEVPAQAVTMGIAPIMKSREILLLIAGEDKREACQRLLSGPVSEEFPASVLRRHPNVTIIASDV